MATRFLYLEGSEVTLRYPLPLGTLSFVKPFANFAVASSSLKDGTTMQSFPLVQSAGVATLWFAVSCKESIARRTSLKFLPVVAG